MKYLIIALFFALSSCIVYGPKTENKTPLSTLNGENYETSPLGANNVLVPVIKTKDRETQIQGRLMFSENGIQLPLRFVKIAMSAADSSQVLQEIATDSDGQFILRGVFRNGDYVLRVVSKKYIGEGTITIKDYQVADVLIIANSLPQK